MDEGKFKFIFIVILQKLCDTIKNYFDIEYEEAIDMLYHSKLYKALENEETKMWYYSNFDLFNMFLEEKETGSYTVYGG